MSTDFFAARLLADLDGKPALEGALEALLASREVGFDYADDEEAVKHFQSESEEIANAFKFESREASVAESGDMIIILAELIRRRDADIVTTTKEGTRKFLTRLAYVEKLMAAEGKTWQTVGTWKDDVKPNYWDRAKAAGL
jgi:ATP diphosphatase